jgi:hypothetical protein
MQLIGDRDLPRHGSGLGAGAVQGLPQRPGLDAKGMEVLEQRTGSHAEGF